MDFGAAAFEHDDQHTADGLRGLTSSKGAAR